jgi:hypothetical protein
LAKLNWIALKERPAVFEEKCEGRNGQVWAYTVSHGQLLVRFYDDESASKQAIYLRCKDVGSVSFRKHWHKARPEVQISEDDNGEPVVAISDGENLTIECGFAFWIEHDGVLDSDSAFF